MVTETTYSEFLEGIRQCPAKSYNLLGILSDLEAFDESAALLQLFNAFRDALEYSRGTEFSSFVS